MFFVGKKKADDGAKAFNPADATDAAPSELQGVDAVAAGDKETDQKLEKWCHRNSSLSLQQTRGE